MDVAIACCRESPTAAATSLFPDPDSALLAKELARIGVRAALVAWDDPALDWRSFDVVLIRSTWDSVDRPDEYLAWTRHVSTLSTLHNPADVLAWNLDKRYLAELATVGIPIVPTRWFEPDDTWEPATVEHVVKPSISAGGRETARYVAGDTAAGEHVRRLQRAGRTVMVQDHVASVDVDGEISIIFIEDAFSHAVRKGPLLRAGEGVLTRPWERPTARGPATPSADELVLAHATVAAIHDRFADALLYSRVDLVGTDDGAAVLEVELIDPSLSLSSTPHAVTALAAAVAARSRY